MGRSPAHGEGALSDRSSCPELSPNAISSSKALAIVELRRRRLAQARIAVRYEHAHPGGMVHIDTRKLARIERMSHRVTGNRRDTVGGAGWEFLFVAIDDHARVGFTEMYADERRRSAVQFLESTVAYFHSLGVRVGRVLADNGSAFRSKAFAKAGRRLKRKHRFTRPFRPRTNGKAERFVLSALREWAYGIPCNHSSERTNMLDRWTHHYNWHRPHQGINGIASMSRLRQSGNDLLTLHN